MARRLHELVGGSPARQCGRRESERGGGAPAVPADPRVLRRDRRDRPRLGRRDDGGRGGVRRARHPARGRADRRVRPHRRRAPAPPRVAPLHRSGRGGPAGARSGGAHAPRGRRRGRRPGVGANPVLLRGASAPRHGLGRREPPALPRQAGRSRAQPHDLRRHARQARLARGRAALHRGHRDPPPLGLRLRGLDPQASTLPRPAVGRPARERTGDGGARGRLHSLAQLLRVAGREAGLPGRRHGRVAERAVGDLQDRIRGDAAAAPAREAGALMPEAEPPRLPITAVVGSHDEAPLLPACLQALAFCDELIVVDIACSDDTRAVAEAHGARVIPHAWVPIAEQAREQAIAEARHDWLLIRDPDEVIPPGLQRDLREVFPTLGPAVGLVTAPTQRFFRRDPMRGTVWGGVKRDRLLAKRGLDEFPTAVHRRLPRREGVEVVDIPYRGDNAILHYWVSGYRVFLERHARYLRLEGPGRADAGEVTGPGAIARAPVAAFRRSFLRERGYRDGLRGLVLSVAWAVYAGGSELMLLRELRRRR